MESPGGPLQAESAQATYTSPAASGSAALTSNPITSMSRQNAQPVVVDDAMLDDVPPTQRASPARGAASGRGRGRGGRWGRTRNRVTKPAQQQKAPAGRGRRQKVFDSLKAQAAHERAHDLKQAFSALVKLVKPAVQEIADRSINELLEDPAAFRKVPEYTAVQNFLRERHEDQVRQCDMRRKMGLAMIEHVYEAECAQVVESTSIQAADLCEERYGQLLRQLDILEYLYDNKLPLDSPALPDEGYIFNEITQEDADCQGVFTQTEDGVEVPFPGGKTISQLMKRPQTMPLEVSKRKADGQPDGQPSAKIPATAKDDDALPQMPRHPAGLLGAVEAIEESTVTTPESASNAPTPAQAAEPAEDAAPGRTGQPAASGEATPDDGPELPLPRGASDPDEYGVRIISRRATRLDIPNNRIIVPNLFEWDDLDIGFRDSSNCAQRNANKQRRGKYMGKPGSNYMFIDRRAGIWDATLAAHELDQELVKKHNLHPTLGIFLPNSINDAEPPKPIVTGWKPVVLVSPSGDVIHTSRTIQAVRADQEARKVEGKIEFARRLRCFCEQEGISAEDVAPSAEDVERNRTSQLVARGIDPAQVVDNAATQAVQNEPSPGPEPVHEDTAGFSRLVDDVLDAAAAVEADEEAARTAAAQRAQLARSYDAIRDVFTDNPVALQPPPLSVQDAEASDAADTSNLSCLADAALRPEPRATKAPVAEPVHYNQVARDGVARARDYDLEFNHLRPAERARPEPSAFNQQNEVLVQSEPVRANDFLRTALNSQPPTYPPHPVMPIQEYPGVQIVPSPAQAPAAPVRAPALAPARAPAPAPAPAPGLPPALAPALAPAPIQPPHALPGRIPFSNAGTAKGLPALRPMPNPLDGPPSFPEAHGSPALRHSSMAVSNTGAYFAPTPSRAYHSGYSVQESVQPVQASMQQQLTSAPSRHLRPYSVSPPPYHHHQPGMPPALGPAPLRSAAGPPPLLPQGAAQQPIAPAPLPTTTTTTTTSAALLAPRSRPGSSSAAAAASSFAAAAAAAAGAAVANTTNPPPQGASSSSSKYRKLEPAPTPPHRLAYGGAHGQELRTVQFDYREAIKDYTPVEAPPRHGPTQIRGWTHHNNLRKTAAATAAAGRPSSSSSRGAPGGDASQNMPNINANANAAGSDEPV